MPTYDFICADGHVSELRRGYDDEVTVCPKCGDVAVRNPINEHQSLVTDTGMKAGRRAPVPRDERRLKSKFDRFREASMEVDYAYSKAEAIEERSINPRLWEKGVARARALKANGVTAEEFAKRSTA